MKQLPCGANYEGSSDRFEDFLNQTVPHLPIVIRNFLKREVIFVSLGGEYLSVTLRTCGQGSFVPATLGSSGCSSKGRHLSTRKSVPGFSFIVFFLEDVEEEELEKMILCQVAGIFLDFLGLRLTRDEREAKRRKMTLRWLELKYERIS
jgi:hypothetical protein